MNQRWEYLRIDQIRGIDLANGFTSLEPRVDLEEIGNEGWELVALVTASSFTGRDYAGTTSGLLWVFKRPKP